MAVDVAVAGRGQGRGRRTPKGRQLDPAAAAEVAALLGDRPRRRDLLIEHLHLLQDHYRPSGCRTPEGAGRDDAAGRGRGLRGRHLLRPFRRRGRGRGRTAAPDHPGLRQPDLQPDGRRAADRRARGRRRSPGVSASSARPAWAPATRAPALEIGHRQLRPATSSEALAAAAAGRTTPSGPRLHRAAALPGIRRLRPARAAATRRSRQRRGRPGPRFPRPARGLGPARPRRRRLSDRTQMADRHGPARPARSSASMPTRASPAPSRTATTSRPTRTASSRAC